MINMEKNVKKNLIYNLAYQLLIMVIPFITSPYIARVLLPKGTGIYTYTYSIVYYFMLITMLGVNNYGNRTIAKVRDDKEKLESTFWSIYSIQLIMGFIMLVIYFLYIFMFDIKYKSISMIQSLFIISAILDINWFFFGMEEFKKTITRNSIVKILNAILIFLCIKKADDIWKYCLIMSGMTCLSQLLMWGYLRSFISFKRVSYKEIKKHIKPNLMLFIPVIAVSIYKMMDKVMLGLLSIVDEVGYYENAEKIISIPLTLIAALGTVMLPRVSNIVSKGDNNKVKEYLKKSISFVSCLSLGMCFGLITIGMKFAPMFFGNSFKKTGVLIVLLSTTIPFVAFANVLRTQYLIPKEKDKVYIKSVFLGAIINLIMNFILIPKFASIGACFGTIAAEISVMVYQTIAIRKELPIKNYMIILYQFFIKAILMFALIYPLNYINISNLLRLLLQVSLGIIFYGIFNMKYVMSIINIKSIINKFKKT